MIRPDAFSDFKDFGNRYCDPKMSNFARVIEYKGATCTQELHFMLKHSLMIRRLKSEVLSELPPKTRIKISIEIDTKTERWLEREMVALQGQTGKGGMPGFLGRATLDENTVYGNGPADEDANKNSGEALAQMMVMYKKTGIAKVEGAINFLTDMMENEVKFLIFAHHLECLDRIEEFITKKDKKYIRIDGSVNPLARQQAVNNFQSNDEITVAILSLTAASQGITLTKASTVVFLEMHWTPGIMFQAEDRCHRVSQKNNVTCYYLHTEYGLDPFLYENIETKYHSVSSFLDGKSKSLDMIVEKKPEEKKPANGNSDIMSWMVPSDKSSNENISDGQKSCLDKNGGPGPGPQPIAKKDNSVFELDDDLLSELDAVLNDNTNGLNIKKERQSNLKSFPGREVQLHSESAPRRSSNIGGGFLGKLSFNKPKEKKQVDREIDQLWDFAKLSQEIEEISQKDQSCSAFKDDSLSKYQYQGTLGEKSKGTDHASLKRPAQSLGSMDNEFSRTGKEEVCSNGTAGDRQVAQDGTKKILKNSHKFL